MLIGEIYMNQRLSLLNFFLVSNWVFPTSALAIILSPKYLHLVLRLSLVNLERQGSYEFKSAFRNLLTTSCHVVIFVFTPTQ